MCLCTKEITRKQLARGRQLLFPTARSGLGGQQQDAVGEKWLGGPAAALGQSHHTGQGQVGFRPVLLLWTRGLLELEAHVWIKLFHYYEAKLGMGAEQGCFFSDSWFESETFSLSDCL